MRICNLKEKEIINICDGECIGNACDLEFDEITGKICSIIVPGECKILGILGRDYEYIIPYQCIKRIGADVILVEVNLEKCKYKINVE